LALDRERGALTHQRAGRRARQPPGGHGCPRLSGSHGSSACGVSSSVSRSDDKLVRPGWQDSVQRAMCRVGICKKRAALQVCGDAFTLAGFPPWRLRLAEVDHLGGWRALTPARFAGALRRYRRTRQRFGA
jgi:hypothetical protein